MTDARLYLAVGLPILAVITSLIISLLQISGIRDDIRELWREQAAVRQDVHAEIQGLGTKIESLTGKVWELMGHK